MDVFIWRYLIASRILLLGILQVCLHYAVAIRFFGGGFEFGKIAAASCILKVRVLMAFRS